MTTYDISATDIEQPVMGVDFTRVHVIAPQTRIDVALPSDVPVADLLGTLLEMSGQRGGASADSWSGWHLTSVTGDRLEAARTLRAANVLDGTVLRLTPAQPTLPEPVFDDVVDAIASAAQATDSRSLRIGAGAFAAVAALLTACAILLIGQHGASGAASAGVVAAIALVTGAGLARSGASRMLAVAIAACAVPAAAVAGLLAVPGSSFPDFDYPGVTTGAALALATAVIALLLLGVGIRVFTALSVLSAITLTFAIAGMVLAPAPAQLVVLASAVAIGLMSAAPWISVRLARLPVPVIPTSAEDLADTAMVIDPRDIGRRAAVASEHLEGILIACALVASLGAVVSAGLGTWLGGAFAVVTLLVLLMRVRSLRSTVSRAALLLPSVIAAAVVVFGAALVGGPSWHFALVAVCLVVMAVIVLLTEVAPRHRLSPAAERGIDLIEGLLLVSVLPLALGAAQLYSAVRSW